MAYKKAKENKEINERLLKNNLLDVPYSWNDRQRFFAVWIRNDKSFEKTAAICDVPQHVLKKMHILDDWETRCLSEFQKYLDDTRAVTMQKYESTFETMYNTVYEVFNKVATNILEKEGRTFSVSDLKQLAELLVPMNSVNVKGTVKTKNSDLQVSYTRGIHESANHKTNIRALAGELRELEAIAEEQKMEEMEKNNLENKGKIEVLDAEDIVGDQGVVSTEIELNTNQRTEIYKILNQAKEIKTFEKKINNGIETEIEEIEVV